MEDNNAYAENDMTDRRSFLAIAAGAIVAPGTPGQGPTDVKTELVNSQQPAMRSRAGIAIPDQERSPEETNPVRSAGALYATIANGLISTPEGGYFAVVGDNADADVILYRKMSGAAAERSRYVSKVAYEGETGAALIGFKRSAAAEKRGLDAEIADGVVNIRQFIYPTDQFVSDGIDRAAAFAESVNKPVYVPGGIPYQIVREHLYPTGLIGDGRDFSRIQVHESARTGFNIGGSAADGRMAAVRIGRHNGEGHADRQYQVPVRGFSVRGLSTRLNRANGIRSSQNFNGVGLLYDNLSAFIHASDVGAEFFDKGIDHANSAGHLGGTGIYATNNWYNLFWTRNAGDYRYLDCIFAGAIFATYGFTGSRFDPNLPSGIDGLTLIGCHGGFCPFLFWGEDGDDTTGITKLIMIASSAEQIGNQVIRLGKRSADQRRVSRNWMIMGLGHSWTYPGSSEDAAWSIKGNAYYPYQTTAVGPIDLLQGGGIEVIGDGWLAGSSGYAVEVTDALAFMKDPRGTSLYKVTNQGQERIVGTGRPYPLIGLIKHAQTDESDSTVVLGRFDIPIALDGSVLATFDYNFVYHNNLGTVQENAQIALYFNGVRQSGFRNIILQPGKAQATGKVTFAMPSADRPNNIFNITVKLLGITQVEVSPSLPGEATLTIINQGAQE